jgi:hypothetical protein
MIELRIWFWFGWGFARVGRGSKAARREDQFERRGSEREAKGKVKKTKVRKRNKDSKILRDFGF